MRTHEGRFEGVASEEGLEFVGIEIAPLPRPATNGESQFGPNCVCSGPDDRHDHLVGACQYES